MLRYEELEADTNTDVFDWSKNKVNADNYGV